MNKKKQNGMYGLLAVIALMLAVTIYASCSSEDDTWDSSSLGELGTMADGTLDRSGEGGGTVYFVGMYIPANIATLTMEPLMAPSYVVDLTIGWHEGYTGNIILPYCNPYVLYSPYNERDTVTLNDSAFFDISPISASASWDQNNKLTMTYVYKAYFKNDTTQRITMYTKKFKKSYSYNYLLEHCFEDDENN